MAVLINGAPTGSHRTRHEYEGQVELCFVLRITRLTSPLPPRAATIQLRSSTQRQKCKPAARPACTVQLLHYQEDAEKGPKGPLKYESEILQVWGKRETSQPQISRTEETGKLDRVMTLLSFPTNTKGIYKLETISCPTPKKTKPTQSSQRRTWVPKMRDSHLTLEHNFYYI